MNAIVPFPPFDKISPVSAPGADLEMARATVERLHADGRRSPREMLHELRCAFPHSPLALRVRALEALRER